MLVSKPGFRTQLSLSRAPLSSALKQFSIIYYPYDTAQSLDTTYLRYTVLTNPKKGETAVHCCDPTSSILVMLVMLVSRNVFHVVSALQSIVCLHTFFLADQISCRSYVGSVYLMRSLAVSGFSAHHL